MVVVDEKGDVLLVRVVDPIDGRPPVWLCPGGGVEAGESLAEAAVRELREETGLVVAVGDLGDPVAVTFGDWEFRGEPLSSEDTFFFLRTQRYEPNVQGQQALEAEIHDRWRWWPLAELRSTEVAVLPHGLADLLGAIAARGLPAEVVVLPWLVI